MVTDFSRLANAILNGTRDRLIIKFIHEHVDEIVQVLEINGYYENSDLNFRLELSQR